MTPFRDFNGASEQLVRDDQTVQGSESDLLTPDVADTSVVPPTQCAVSDSQSKVQDISSHESLESIKAMVIQSPPNLQPKKYPSRPGLRRAVGSLKTPFIEPQNSVQREE